MCQENSTLVKRGNKKYCYKLMQYNHNGFRTPFQQMPMSLSTEKWQNDRGWISTFVNSNKHHVGKLSVFKHRSEAIHFFRANCVSGLTQLWKVEVRDKEVLEGDFNVFDGTYISWLVNEIRFVERIL